MERSDRYLAVKVDTGRYRLIGYAKPEDATNFPDQVVLFIPDDKNWVPVVSVRRGWMGILEVENALGVSVENAHRQPA